MIGEGQGEKLYCIIAGSAVRDFQKINYSINNNDNHFKGG